jgi:XTP/dITP diphosphohydrolase
MLKDYKVRSIYDLDENIDIIEDGNTFKANAIIKAEYVCKNYGIDCISDDSGIEVEAINNEPGIYSARYLGEKSTYIEKMNDIMNRIKDSDNRNCRYVCAIALARSGKETICVEGYCNGLVTDKIEEGNYGFGYDPMFYSTQFKKNMNLVSEDDKNSISHRRNALDKLMRYLNEENNN